MPNVMRTQLHDKIEVLPFPKGVDYGHQANVVPGSKKAGSSGTWCCLTRSLVKG